MFEIAEELEDTYLDEKVIKPMNSSSAVVLPETSPTHIEYRYALGRGVGVMDNIRRRLEDGVLPIYHSEMTDDDIVYRSTSFVSLAGTPLNERTVRGTHYLISDRTPPAGYSPTNSRSNWSKYNGKTRPPNRS